MMSTRSPTTRPIHSCVINTRIGPMRIELDEHDHLTQVTFSADTPSAPPSPTPAAIASLLAQLDEFAAGSLESFDLPLANIGTEFERAVWAVARTIPRGHTATYSQLAASLGKPNAARAVGGALGRNPFHVIVPCHRVVGRDGSLTGYAAGVDIKQRLLELEQHHQPR
ncbi:MAG: methylated-DNA--[protein]-cysteine S-methyltransferase [Phycisphaerales bacterium]|jgi:methylated-DNA-[protein]-cysteine S-methyltransferase